MQFRKLCDFFVIELESLSRFSVTFLDVSISKGPRFDATGFLDSDLYEKPSSIKLPLSKYSAHNPAIHRHWPTGQVLRFRRLCNTHTSLSSAVSRFAAKLEAGDANTAALKLIPKPRPRLVSQRPQTTWLVMPFRFHWFNVDFQSRLRLTHSLYGRALERSAPNKAFICRVSWKNQCRNILRWTKHSNSFV